MRNVISKEKMKSVYILFSTRCLTVLTMSDITIFVRRKEINKDRKISSISKNFLKV